MSLDDQLDDALRRLPVWTPPARFAGRVAAMAGAEIRSARSESPPRVWARYAAYGTAVAAVGWAVGAGVWWMLESYLRLMTVAAEVMIMEPVAVSWTCAALSLLTAVVFARRALV